MVYGHHKGGQAPPPRMSADAARRTGSGLRVLIARNAAAGGVWSKMGGASLASDLKRTGMTFDNIGSIARLAAATAILALALSGGADAQVSAQRPASSRPQRNCLPSQLVPKPAVRVNGQAIAPSAVCVERDGMNYRVSTSLLLAINEDQIPAGALALSEGKSIYVDVFAPAGAAIVDAYGPQVVTDNKGHDRLYIAQRFTDVASFSQYKDAKTQHFTLTALTVAPESRMKAQLRVRLGAVYEAGH